MGDIINDAAAAIVRKAEKDNKDLNAGEQQRQRVLKEEARDALNARLRGAKDSNQR